MTESRAACEATDEMTTPIPAVGDAGRSTRDDRSPFASLDWALFVAMGLIWGSSFLLIAIALDDFHPGLITWARVGLGAGALAVLPDARARIDRADWPRIVAMSVVWVAVPFTLFPLAEEHINSAVTGLLNGATPFFAGLFGALFFHRVPRGPQRAGIVVGFAGITLVSLGSAARAGPRSSAWSWSWRRRSATGWPPTWLGHCSRSTARSP